MKRHRRGDSAPTTHSDSEGDHSGAVTVPESIVLEGQPVVRKRRRGSSARPGAGAAGGHSGQPGSGSTDRRREARDPSASDLPLAWPGGNSAAQPGAPWLIGHTGGARAGSGGSLACDASVGVASSANRTEMVRGRFFYCSTPLPLAASGCLRRLPGRLRWLFTFTRVGHPHVFRALRVAASELSSLKQMA